MAKQSLAAQTGTAPALQLPAVFQAPQELIESRAWPPYIAFAHSKRSDEWARIVAKYGNIQEGEMFLIASDVLKLAPAKLGWLCGKQFWAEANAAGEVQRVSWKEMPHPYKERVEAVVLLYLEDRIIPANIQFRTTKCRAAKELSDAAIAAASPDWGDRSPQHKETLVCNQPFMRFYGLVSLSEKRIGKNSGMAYRLTECSVKPTGVSEWRLLKTFVDGSESQKLLEDAARTYTQRLDEMAKKAS